MTPRMGWALGIFQHGFTRRIKGGQTKIWEEGGWEYPPLAAATEEAGFEDMGAYVLKRQDTAAQYIATQTILDLCNNTV